MTPPDAARPGLLDRVERAWPVALFFNPVFQKEMRASGHRSGTYFARGIYGALMLAIVGIALTAAFFESRDNAADMQALQKLAPIMAVVLAWFGLFMLAFIAPVMTVPAFMDERRRRTLPVLMTTPLTSAQIVCAKLASQTIQLLILALMGLPIVLALRIFGGVPASFILHSNAVLLSAALMVSSIGLRYSLYRQRADVAIVGAFVTAAVIQVGPLFLIGIAQWAGAGPRILYFMPITCSPIALATLTAELVNAAGAPPWGSFNAWVGNTLYNLAWALVFILATIIQLRRVLRLEGAGINYLKPRRRATRRAAQSPLAAAAAPHQPALTAVPTEPPLPDAETEFPAPAPPAPDRDTRTISDRPILWRELRQPTFRSRLSALLTTAGLVIIILILYFNLELDEPALHMFIAIPALLFTLLRAAAGSTAAFTTERESRTLETLLTTPLSAREIIWSKFLGALRRQWFIPAVLYTHLILMTLLGGLHPAVLLHIPILLAGAVVFLTATGMFLGLVIRRATTASVANICVGILLWAGIPGLTILLAEFFSFTHALNWERFGAFLFMINPLGQLISALEAATHSELVYGSPGLGSYPFSLFTLFILAATLGYFLAAYAMLAACRAVFTASAGRTS